MASAGEERKYRAIANELRDDILAGRYMPGMAFPSVKMLCRRFGVSHLTAAKVIETLKGMGLVRTRNGAGTFVARRMRSIGFVMVSMIGHEVDILPPIAREVSRLAQTRGIGLDFADMTTGLSSRDSEVVIEAARRMVDSGVSGAIFRPTDFGTKAAPVNRDVLNVFAKAGVPLVLLDFDLGSTSHDFRYDFVGIDNQEAGEMVGRHLLRCGAKSMAFVAWSNMCANVKRRFDGLQIAISGKRGVRFAGRHFLLRDGAALAKKWKTCLPEAIVCASDFVAAHVLKLLKKIGKRCPQDCLITGVNGADLATLVSPQLTTVRQPCEEIARTAFETLFWRMENPNAATRRIFVATDLVIGESTMR